MIPTAQMNALHPDSFVATQSMADFDRQDAYRRAAAQFIEAAAALRDVERSGCVLYLGWAIAAALESLLLSADCDDDTDGDLWSAYELARSVYGSSGETPFSFVDREIMLRIVTIIECVREPIYNSVTPHERISEEDVAIAECGAKALFNILNAK